LSSIQIHEDEKRPSSSILKSLEGAEAFNLEVRPQEKLKAVLELSRTLAGALEVEKILPRILDSLFQIFPAADRGCILLRDPKTGNMVPRAMKQRRESND